MYRMMLKSGNNRVYRVFITRINDIEESSYFKLNEILEIEKLLKLDKYDLENFKVGDIIYIESLDWADCNYNLIVSDVDQRKAHIYFNTTGF